jgi:hypothetical protein
VVFESNNTTQQKVRLEHGQSMMSTNIIKVQQTFHEEMLKRDASSEEGLTLGQSGSQRFVFSTFPNLDLLQECFSHDFAFFAVLSLAWGPLPAERMDCASLSLWLAWRAWWCPDQWSQTSSSRSAT